MTKILAGNNLPVDHPVGSKISKGTTIVVMAEDRTSAIHDAIDPDRPYKWTADADYIVTGTRGGDLYHYKSITIRTV